MQFSKRTYPIGAEFLEKQGVHFRAWAPKPRSVSLVLEDERGEKSFEVKMSREPGGYWSCHAPQAAAGDLYRFRLGDVSALYPDPASRFQPHGPHGPSQVADPRRFKWTGERWKGVPRHGRVIYEMHIGTFTQEGLSWLQPIACMS